MVNSIGLDLVEIARIEQDLKRYGERFASRILGAEELGVYSGRRDKTLFLAGRFAAKEAVIKALGHYLKKRPALSDIQIINDPSGQPQLKLPEHVLRTLPGHRCLLSITHEKHYAAAMALFEEEK